MSSASHNSVKFSVSKTVSKSAFLLASSPSARQCRSTSTPTFVHVPPWGEAPSPVVMSSKLRGEPMFALEFETALFTLTSKTPDCEPLFALQPRSTRRKPEHRTQGGDSLSGCKGKNKTKNMEISQRTNILRPLRGMGDLTVAGSFVHCVHNSTLKHTHAPFRPLQHTQAPLTTPLLLRREASRGAQRNPRQHGSH